MSINEIKYLKDYQPHPWMISSLQLHFEIFNPMVRVTADLSLQRRIPGSQSVLKLDGTELKLVELYVNHQLLSDDQYSYTPDLLTISNLPDQCVLTIVTETDPYENHSLEGLYASNGILCTQNEPEGFRRITYFIDRPDNMSIYTTKITADKKQFPFLLSNGNPVEKGDLSENRHFAVWHDPFPKPSYLFALVAGQMDLITDTFVTSSNRSIELQIYTDIGNKEKARHAMRCLKNAMKWDEQRFGLECDLSIYMIVAVDAFNAGAMENKGLNIFNSIAVLADEKTATDNNFHYIDRVIAHEYFHNWTGNRVTCRDWFQLTLKEGLTVLRDSEYTGDTQNHSVVRIADVKSLRESQFSEDAGPLAHSIRPESYISINNFYTSTVYSKGSEVIRMILSMVGRDKFRKGIERYFELFDGKAVTTDDFLSAMEQGAGIDLTQFKNWYNQAGTPEVNVDLHFDKSKQIFELKFSQYCRPTPECQDKKPFHIPIKIGFIDPDNGEEMPIVPANAETASAYHAETAILNLREKEQTFLFAKCKKAPIPSLLRDFSAPIKLNYSYSTQELQLLIQHDKDLFNRYEAGQRMIRSALLEAIQQYQKNSASDIIFPDGLFYAWSSFLQDSLDPSFAALSLSLPSIQYLCNELPVFDYDATFAVREAFLTQFALRNEASLYAAYNRNVVTTSYEPNIEQSGKRALRGTILSILSHLTDQYLPLAEKHFSQANNMTDQMTGFAVLAQYDTPVSQMAIQQFKDQWQQDPLVMNHWIAVLASSKMPNAIQRIMMLEKDPVFDPKNPNKIRSLFGSFIGNHTQFHHFSGEGYRLLADRILSIDQFNPQLSSALAKSAFSKLKRLDHQRQNLMGSVIQSILSQSNQNHLSENLFEILSKTIEN